MAKEKAKVVLAHDVWEQIEWLTRNFDKEIGAVGSVEIRQEDGGEKYFFVDKIFFPNQKVSAATIEIEPDGWGSILKEMNTDEMGRIGFYWHRHPGGSAHHSGTDEEHTFGAFMDEDAQRNHFVFLQTAKRHNGEINFECRVDLRQPVRVSVLDSQVELLIESPETTDSTGFLEALNGFIEEYSEENDLPGNYHSIVAEYFSEQSGGLIKERMEKIIEDRIIKKTTKITGWRRGKSGKKYSGTVNERETVAGIKQLFREGASEKDISDARLKSALKNVNIVNNNTLRGFGETPSEYQATLEFRDGAGVVTCEKAFEKVIESALDDKDGKLRNYVRQHSKETTSSGRTKYKLQPAMNSYYRMVYVLLMMFKEFNKKVKNLMKEKNDFNDKDDDHQQGVITDSSFIIEDHDMATEVVALIDDSYEIVWTEDGMSGQVYTKEQPVLLGEIRVDAGSFITSFHGEILRTEAMTILKELKAQEKENIDKDVQLTHEQTVALAKMVEETK